MTVNGQNVSLYNQFNGRYDFKFIGNTLNTTENGFGSPCTINTSSSTNLTLQPGDLITNAYLYWAGSGTGDFNVTLNGQAITSQRQFSIIQSNSGLPFFSAFADITSQIISTGPGNYTLSDLDLTAVIPNYCPNATNFGGWAIIIVYQNAALPLNQLNIYDGLQAVPTQIDITLNNLNVIDNQDAKIGFLAWEGDRNIAVNETLRINGNIISNPPLNPADNAFNGTNSETGSSSLYNMDLDVYNIQNNIAIGDTYATIQLTSGQDFVMINAIVTKLNSQLPDATVSIDQYTQSCNSNQYVVNFTVRNFNATEILPAGTFLTFYADGVVAGQFITPNPIAINASESFTTTITTPSGLSTPFQLEVKVDDNQGIATVTELLETNNTDIITITPWVSPLIKTPENIVVCNEGNGKGTFDFSNYVTSFLQNPTDVVSYFETEQEALQNNNAIVNTSNYVVLTTPKTIYIRIENEHCHTISHFDLQTKPCPPVVYNHFTPNEDGFNDGFYIDGLRDIFKNFKLEIYNRWGTLVWTGDNNTPDWDGYANKGILFSKKQLPAGTYYYILYLNEPEFEKPMTGWVFLNK